MITVDVATHGVRQTVDAAEVRRAVTIVLRGECVAAATISVAVVDDARIRLLNRQYLNHDYATDVLSFRLDEGDGPTEGEIVVSLEMAAAQAARYGWETDDELLLYVVHGTLHLVGYDDATEAERGRMRAQERHYLTMLGRETPPDDVRKSIATGVESGWDAAGGDAG